VSRWGEDARACGSHDRSMPTSANRRLSRTDASECRTARVSAESERIVAICAEYASQERYHSVTLADLCGVSGVSERRVRYAFSDCLDTSPTAHMRTAALHEVRRTLLEGDLAHDAVTRAACDHGFGHLSRFAGQYRELFGERPSATVAGRADVVDAA
jgi:AraC family transcriptional regulator, ethanolamine operon transcriptional activator